MAQSNEMTGGEAMARCLKAFNAGPMFGMGGFQLLAFYDAARRFGLDHHLINDERCGVFAADAYAKVSGRVGLVDATLGPGATNLVTGLIEALNAGTPLVAFVGDTHRAHSWKNMTQEARQSEILRPACKDFLRIEHNSRVPELIRRAFLIATSGRPGPVVVAVPEDICHGTLPFNEEELAVDARYEAAPAIRCRPAADDTARAARLLASAKRPLMLCGGGVHISGAAQLLTGFARSLNLPVAHTLTGKGAIPCTDPLSAGLFGRYDRIANALIDEADVLLVVGCKLGEIATKRFTIPPKGKTVIHLDIVAEEFGRTYRPPVALWGDVREGIRDLAAALAGDAKRQQGERADYVADVGKRMAAWKAGVMERLTSGETPINVARMLHELNGVMPADGILVADGGFAAHWAGLLYDTKQAGRGFVPDRGFASIGYGLPGAIGAAHGSVVCHRRLQQRRLGLREGAAAPDVRGGRLSVVGLGRDQLRQGGRGDGLHGDTRGGSRGSRGGIPQGPASQRRSHCHRRGGHPRPGPHAAGRRQPRGAGQERRQGRVAGTRPPDRRRAAWPARESGPPQGAQ